MIYHITDSESWKRALQSGFYVHPSLKDDGIIHAVKEKQVLDVVEKDFADAEELVILHIVERRLQGKITYVEENGIQQPRIHGRIPIEAIEDVSVVPRMDDGNFNWDEF
jgi:uncharacterized protein (DUF952 family)